MNLKQCFLYNNDCYKTAKPLKPSGIMVHSTGADNPNLRRYVQPDDGLLGINTYNNDWNRPRPGRKQVCVHAFIGKLNDGSVATYQTLPWDIRGWHAGGKANDTHIGFEICEDNLNNSEYFTRVYNEAAELCAMLCQQFGLTEKNIICHSEGYKRRIASNHSDVMHWFPIHGKSMDSFRAAVGGMIKQMPDTPTPRPTLRRGISGSEVRELQNRLVAQGYKLPGYGADGDFGLETETAVKSFQTDKRLVVDGIVGPKTWAALG